MNNSSDIKHCLNTIMGIQKGSVPLMPELGCDLIQAIGQPAPIAIRILKALYTKEIPKQEPRVKLVSITGEVIENETKAAIPSVGKIHMKIYYKTINGVSRLDPVGKEKVETTEIFI